MPFQNLQPSRLGGMAMGKFADNEWFEIEHCYSCGIAFALTADFQRRRRNDHATFYCPAGHGQHYAGQTEVQKLKQQLDQQERQLGQQARKLESAEQRAATAQRERDTIAKAHRKMRKRVANGVCPCCNRSFENLRQHMQSQHPDFGQEQTLKALRQAFGMTQADLAAEAYVLPSYVSQFENSRPVPAEARARLNWWMESNGGGHGRG